MDMYYLVSPGVSADRLLQAFPQAREMTEHSSPDETVDTLIWCFLPQKGDLSGMVKRLGAARIVALSNEPASAQAYEVFKAGVHGYCHAQSSAALLAQVATTVSSGGIWVGAEFMPHLLQGVDATFETAAVRRPAPDISILTSRELEVVEQVCTGASNKEVARTLNITERTVKAHLTAAFEKLGIRDRVQLVIQLKAVIS